MKSLQLQTFDSNLNGFIVISLPSNSQDSQSHFPSRNDSAETVDKVQVVHAVELFNGIFACDF